MNHSPQMVMVTKQRKRVGGFGVFANIVLTVFTGGLWLIVPISQWALHALGPRRKIRTAVYTQPPHTYYRPALPQQYGFVCPQQPTPAQDQPGPGWQWDTRQHRWLWRG